LGETVVRYASNVATGATDAGLFAFERTRGDAGDAYALVVLNANGTQESSPPAPGIAVELAPGASLVDALDPGHAPFVVTAEGAVALTVPAQSTRILVLADQFVPN
jgi:hypothetical protein